MKKCHSTQIGRSIPKYYLILKHCLMHVSSTPHPLNQERGEKKRGTGLCMIAFLVILPGNLGPKSLQAIVGLTSLETCTKVRRVP